MVHDTCNFEFGEESEEFQKGILAPDEKSESAIFILVKIIMIILVLSFIILFYHGLVAQLDRAIDF